jgi:hypothetical protein
MNFITNNLCTDDQKMISDLKLRIHTNLTMATTKLNQGVPGSLYIPGSNNSEIWFGDSSTQWLMTLRSKLLLMANALIDPDAQSIEIFGPHKLTDSGRILTDYAPLRYLEYHCHDTTLDDHQRYHLHPNVQDTDIEDNQYSIRLNPGWYYALPYTYDCTKQYTKLHILTHGLTHLLIQTKDHQYGYRNCQQLVLSSTANAKVNSDSWAFFIDACTREETTRL